MAEIDAITLLLTIKFAKLGLSIIRESVLKLSIDKEYNIINVLLSIIILLSVAYIGVRLNNNQPTITSRLPRETKLPLTLSADWTTAALTNELKIINTAVDQQKLDQALVNKSFNDQRYQLRDNYYQLSSAVIEINSREKILEQAELEIKATTQLTPSQTKGLLNQLATQVLLLDYINKTTTFKNNNVNQKLKFEYPSFAQNVDQAGLIKVADDQQASEELLNKVANNLSLAISSASVQGVLVTNFQADLTTLTSDIKAAHGLSNSYEQSLVNSSLSINQLEQVNKTLITSQLDIMAAINAATTIVQGLVSS